MGGTALTYESLLQKYSPLMRYIIAPILSDPRDREECLADAAMRAWNALDTYDPGKGSFTTWLTVLTRNTALNRVRGIKPTEPIPENLEDPAGNPETIVIRRENREELRKALNSLPHRDGRVYSAPYYSLSTINGVSSSVFFHNGPSTDTIALFSLPRSGENCRGYICYSVEEFNPGHILDSWFNYYYQESGLQYPVRTAADVIVPGTAGNRGIFDCVATALQMSYDADKAISEGIYDFHFIG